MSGKVTTSESIGLGVTKQLRNYGFFNPYPSGVDHDGQEKNALYIVLRVRHAGRFFFSSDRTFVFGILYLNNPHIGAETKKNWILHLNGRDNTARAIEIANLLAKAFDVNIHVRLEQEEMEEEVPAGLM